jgi:hypothetical protein
MEETLDWLRFLDSHKTEHDRRLTQHLTEPHISSSEYSQKMRHELGSKALGKKRIYLDQKYWIYLRDAKNGIPQRPIHAGIWQIIRSSVNKGMAVCPVSYPVYCETFKQANPLKRRETAEIIDELSLGIAIQPFLELLKIELLHLLLHFSGMHTLPLENMVWLPVGYICGELIPTNTAFDAAIQTAIQKTMYDVMASSTFQAHIEALEPVATEMLHDDSEFQERQNTQCELHRHEFKTFHEAFMIEVRGFLDGIHAELDIALKQLYEKSSGILPDPNDMGATVAVRLYSNLLYHAYNEKKLTTEFPSLYIACGIHAATRHQNRTFSKGDRDDHLHAKSALPYFDIFLTERKLGTLLTSKPLEYDRQFSCEVLWNDDLILARLKEILQ